MSCIKLHTHTFIQLFILRVNSYILLLYVIVKIISVRKYIYYIYIYSYFLVSIF